MSGNTDFVALYRELGLSADCTIESFKQAYRRRVGELHPDRAGDAASTSRLQQLNLQYAAAMAFQRAHSRLPGAVRAATPPQPGAEARPEPVAAACQPRPASPRQVWRFVIPLLAICLLLVLYPAERDPALGEARPGTPGAVMTTPDANTMARSERVTVGMPAARAREILGEPLRADPTHWDYSPSWVELRCGRVSRWYSSPVRPLKVEASSSSDRDPAGAARGNEFDC